MIFDAIRKWMGASPREEGDGGRVIPCQEALARVQEFLDGELADAPREEVERHFRVCSRCYPHLRLETAFREALRRAADGHDAPPELRERVLALVEREAAAE